MSRLPLAFFATAALFALVGMLWGVAMGMANNFTEAPAHAHLNLVGWASLALMGAFYGFTGDRAPRRLGWINYVVSTAAVLVMVPSLAVMLAGNNAMLPVVIAGSLLAIAGMALFLTAVVMTWRAPVPASA